MAKNSIRDYDATSGNNTDVQSVNIDESCPASGINNAIREVMADLKDVSTGTVKLETPAADQLNVDNIRLDGNTISSTDTNGDISLSPNGTGAVEVSSSSTPTINIKSTDAVVVVDDVVGAITFEESDATGGTGVQAFIKAIANDSGNTYDMSIGVGGNTEAIRVDQSGNVGIGSSSPPNLLTLQSTGSTKLNIRHTASGNGYGYIFRTTGSTTNHLIVESETNGTATERMRIATDRVSLFKNNNNFATPGYEFDSDGQARFTNNDASILNMNRVDNDGTLMQFHQGGTEEGSISVSGTTVSFNGGHLSRWSQATDGNRITGLVKGTVMANLDQMAVWHHEAQAATYYTEGDELPDGVSVGDEKTPAIAAYDEQNEQLNCMAVSSVEGDANVAGVFVNWDDDDEDFTADMNVAMTGDMVIRIASGTTVARGDLLMSAGDGTAKPQGDDIVRSKTIAKVTSTTVSHTYDDGTFLVPCVLMAC